MALSDALVAWEAALEGEDLSPHTRRAYRADMIQFRRWWEETTGEAFDPAALTLPDLRDWRAFLQRRYKPATVNRKLEALRHFGRWAVETGRAPENVPARLKGLPEVELAPRGLTRKEQHALIRAVQRFGTVRDRALIVLLLHTGLRVSEVTALQVADLVLRERSGHVRVRYGKRRKSRDVPLNATVRRVLVEYLSERGDSDAPEQFVFLNRLGERLGDDGVGGVVAKYARLAGLEGVTPHVLRHTFAHEFLAAGWRESDLAAILGHTNLQTTRRYTLPRMEALQRQVEALSWE